MQRAQEIFILVLTVMVAAAILFGFLAFDRNENSVVPERTAQQDQGRIAP
jgi:hypothetical protein